MKSGNDTLLDSPLSLVYLDEGVVVAANEDDLNKAVLDWIKPGHKWWRRWRNPKDQTWEYEYLDFQKHKPRISVSEHKTNANLFNVNVLAPHDPHLSAPEKAHIRALHDKMRQALGSLVRPGAGGDYEIPAQGADVLHEHFGDAIAYSTPAKKALEKWATEVRVSEHGVHEVGTTGLMAIPYGKGTIVGGNVVGFKDMMRNLGGEWNHDRQGWAFKNEGAESVARRIHSQILYRDEQLARATARAGDTGTAHGAGGTAAKPGGQTGFRQGTHGKFVPSDESGQHGVLNLESVERPPVVASLSSDTQQMLHNPRMNDDQNAGQVEDANSILSCFARGNQGYLLANAAGTGKTYIAMSVIAEMKPTLPVLWTVPDANHLTLYNQIKGAAKKFGWNVELWDGKKDITPKANTVYVCHYINAGTKSLIQNRRWGLVVLDECHRAKNLTGIAPSKSARGVRSIVNNADHSLWMSATPFTDASDLGYLETLGLWGKGNFEQFAIAHGVKVTHSQIFDEETGALQEFCKYQFDGTIHDLLAINKRMIEEGVSSYREARIDHNLNNNFNKVTISPEFQKTYNDAMDAFDVMSAALLSIGDTRRARMISAQRTVAARRILESAKIDTAVALAKAELAAGRQVMITTAYRNEHVRNMAEFMSTLFGENKDDESRRDVGRMLDMKMPQLGGKTIREHLSNVRIDIPSPIEELVRRLGGPDAVAEVHGGVEDNETQAKNVEDYNSGRKRLMIGTIGSLGTGVGAHDTSGSAPRTQINMSLPWTAPGFEQLHSRSHRYGTQSDTNQFWLFADAPSEAKLCKIIATRLTHMGAIVKGAEANANAEEVANFQHMSKTYIEPEDYIGERPEEEVKAHKQQVSQIENVARWNKQYGGSYDPAAARAMIFGKKK